jgi:hypothetical protein
MTKAGTLNRLIIKGMQGWTNRADSAEFLLRKQGVKRGRRHPTSSSSKEVL